MVTSKKAKVMGRFWQKYQQLEKLKYEIKGEGKRILCESEGFDAILRLDHFDISIRKSRLNRIGVNDHR